MLDFLDRPLVSMRSNVVTCGEKNKNNVVRVPTLPTRTRVPTFGTLITAELRQMAPSGVHLRSVETPKRVSVRVRVGFTVTVSLLWLGLSSDTRNSFWSSNTGNSYWSSDTWNSNECSDTPCSSSSSKCRNSNTSSQCRNSNHSVTKTN